MKEGTSAMPWNISPANWDIEYRSGKWAGLWNSSESAHYAVIAGYLRSYVSDGRVLDCACGEGVLFDYLHPGTVKEYVGFDWSEEAIRRFAARCGAATLSCCNVERYDPGNRRFHAIVFCEILYHLSRPHQVLQRYANFLEDDGIIVVSIYCQDKDDDGLDAQTLRTIWSGIDVGPWITRDQTLVTTGGQSWMIRVLQRNPAFAGSGKVPRTSTAVKGVSPADYVS
jgi:SAM-dependent methyltransferase